MRRKILAYSYLFQKMYLSKDIFLIPYYISKEKGLKLEYRYNENLGDTNIPQIHRDARIKESCCGNEFLSLLWYVVLHAWTIELLFLNGSSAKHMFAVWLFKMLHPKGKVVVFGDMERPQAEEFAKTGFVFSSGLAGWLKELLTNYFFNHVTYIVANTEAYEIMKELCDRKGWKGLSYFYPCLDDELFNKYGLKRVPFLEKENIIICVGRIGNHQKNTEMLLEALENVDLKDWKIYMIGPVTSSFDLKEGGGFQCVIDDFFERCPQHKNKLIFTGMIYDMKEIFIYYNRAKVLLSTARHEGFANVYSQAAALGCYVISTDVGGADIGSNQWRFGTMLEQESSENLSKVLTTLVEGRLKMDDLWSIPFEEMCYSNRVKEFLFPHLMKLEYE